MAAAQPRQRSGARGVAHGVPGEVPRDVPGEGLREVPREGPRGVPREVLVPLSTRQGLALFDAALRTAEPVLAPILLDRAALRSGGGHLPPPLRGLVRAHRPTAATGAGPAGGSGQWPEPGAWRARLDRLPAADRQAALEELSRADVAAVLGHPDADALPAGRSPAELGFDSLTAVQIRNRLSAALGLRLSASLVFEHRTTGDLARHLLGELSDTPVTTAAPEAERPAYTLSSLFRSVSAAGRPAAAMHLLVTASWALPTFTAARGREHAPPPIRRSHGRTGPGRPTVAYFPAYHPSFASGGGDFPRFHRAFHDDLDVLEFPHPGIGTGSAVPEDLAALARTQAENVLAHVGDGPLVLVGRSAGGNVAHLAAHHLEGIGRAPVGLILLDTYRITPDNQGEDWLLSLAAPPPQDSGRPLFSGDDDSALAALGAYNRIFLGWNPEPVTAPTLLVRASHPTSAMAASADGDGWRTSWPSAHAVLDVPGDHLTMMREHADTTAAAVRSWIEEVSADLA
ncbi:thioesterase domain-containing protein [Streptomyces massasporeus]